MHFQHALSLIISSIFIVFIMNCTTCFAQTMHEKSVSKSNMTVSWFYLDERVYFKVIAPTKGWVTIGFNTTDDISGAHLIMGHVVNGQPNVVEHYTLSPGNYKSLERLGAGSQVQHISGWEKSNETTIVFSLPIKAVSKYRKDLNQGSEHTMILAYSLHDDFQHHSIMRTSEKIIL